MNRPKVIPSHLQQKIVDLDQDDQSSHSISQQKHPQPNNSGPKQKSNFNGRSIIDQIMGTIRKKIQNQKLSIQKQHTNSNQINGMSKKYDNRKHQLVQDESLDDKVSKIFQKLQQHRQTTPLCIICKKLVYINKTESSNCQKCDKTYHKKCLQLKKQCPQCNTKIPQQSYSYNHKYQKNPIAPVIQFSSEENQENEQIETPQFFIDLSQISNQRQVLQLKNLYPLYVKQMDNLYFPINDQLFMKYSFLNDMLDEKQKKVMQFNQEADYTGDALIFWNYTRYFPELPARPKSFKKFLQIFTQFDFVEWLLPIVEIYLIQIKKENNNKSPFVCLIEFMEQIEALKNLLSVAWPKILQQIFIYFNNFKCQKGKEFLQYLTNKYDKRKVKISSNSQILYVLANFSFFLPEISSFRMRIDEYNSERIRENQKERNELEKKKYALMQKKKILHQKIVMTSIETSLEMNIFRQKNKQYLDQQCEILIHKIAQKIVKIQQKIISLFSKNPSIDFLGKDRSGRHYWKVQKIKNYIYISHQYNNKNGKMVEQWSSCPFQSFEQLMETLNPNGFYQKLLLQRLRQQIKRGNLRDQVQQQYENQSQQKDSFKQQRQNYLKQVVCNMSISQIKVILQKCALIFKQICDKKNYGFEYQQLLQVVRNSCVKNIDELKKMIKQFFSYMATLHNFSYERKVNTGFWLKFEAKKYINEQIQHTQSASDIYFIICCFYEYTRKTCNRWQENIQGNKQKKQKIKQSVNKNLGIQNSKNDGNKNLPRIRERKKPSEDNSEQMATKLEGLIRSSRNCAKNKNYMEEQSSQNSSDPQKMEQDSNDEDDQEASEFCSV